MDIAEQLYELLEFQRWLVYGEDRQCGTSFETRRKVSKDMHDLKDEIIAEFKRLQALENA